MFTRARAALASGIAAALLSTSGWPSPAAAATPHTVQPGETLWSIAAAHNLTTRTVAAFNGLPEDARVALGQTVQVPTVEEGVVALAAAPQATPAPADPAPAGGSGGHLVQPGESLSSVAASRGITPAALAAVNGLGPDSYLYVGQRIEVPTAAPATPPAESGGSSTAGFGHVASPYGDLHLAPAAADTWNRMREESLQRYGQDLHPAGPLSAHRSTEQQRELYELHLRGEGPPAAPPGTSNHERGTAVDVETPEMRWVVDQIGHLFGWGKTEAPDEWWHVNFGGAGDG
jgi:LysM repeat protein